MTKTAWPKISLVLLTLNGGKGVKDCLESVKKQTYPKEKIELIVVDNGSIDDSVKIAKRYTKKVFFSNKNGYEARADAMRLATGEFVYMILEQDIEIKSSFFLQDMVTPLLENKMIVASFTREYPRKDQPWVTRFISYHPSQCDPLFEFITPSISSTIVEEKKDYSLCKFILGSIPPTTHMLFRVEMLKKTIVWKQNKDFDHDTITGLVKGGYNFFAYVPKSGLYHHHAKDLKQLIQKRVRNLNRHYFPYQNSIEYKWLDTKNKIKIFKLIVWVVYANLFIPAFIRGLLRYIKYKDWALLMEPIVVIVTTDVILWTFLTNSVGRHLLRESTRTLFNK